MGQADLSFRELLERVAARTATPGGGSVAALGAAAGTALATMAVRYSVPAGEEPAQVFAVVLGSLTEVRDRLLALVDEDADAYASVEAARNLPRALPEEKAARSQELAAALVRAAEVPLRIARLARDALEMLHGLEGRLNRRLGSDAVMAAALLSTGARGAGLYVEANLSGREDSRAQEMRRELETALQRCRVLESELTATLQPGEGGRN